MAKHIKIEEEDSVALENKNKSIIGDKVKVGVLALPHISNFTDFDVLERHPEVNLFYITTPEEIDEADIIIIPGHWRLLKSVNAKLLNSVFMLVTRFSGLQTLSHFSNDYIGVGALKLGSPIFHECRTIHF